MLPQTLEFADLPSQEDINFEVDPISLQRILSNRELSPTSVMTLADPEPPSWQQDQARHGKSAGVTPIRQFGKGILLGVLPSRTPFLAALTKNGTSVSGASKKAATPIQTAPPKGTTLQKDKNTHLPTLKKAGHKAASQLTSGPPRNRPRGKSTANQDSHVFNKPWPVSSNPSRTKGGQMRPAPSLQAPDVQTSDAFRESLTASELERLLSDDCTANFEMLERRLKTPKKPLSAHQVRLEASHEKGKPNGLRQKTSLSISLTRLDHEPDAPLPRSISVQCDLDRQVGHDHGFIQQARHHLDEFRQQQEEINRQIQELMLQKLERKEKFKAIWGVSPININKKRTIKTAIMAHNVLFSDNQDQDDEPHASLPDDLFRTDEQRADADEVLSQSELTAAAECSPTKAIPEDTDPGPLCQIQAGSLQPEQCDPISEPSYFDNCASN